MTQNFVISDHLPACNLSPHVRLTVEETEWDAMGCT